MKILLIEDDKKLNNLIAKFLRQNDYEVIQAYSLGEGRECLTGTVSPLEVKPRCGASRPNITPNEIPHHTSCGRKNIQLILLDIMLPDGEGFDFIKEIRKNSALSIIVLTAKDTKEDIIYGLSLGADDYLVKPFEPEELILRMRKILSTPKPETVSINLNRTSVDISKLTSSEAKILELLYAKNGEPVSREEVANLFPASISDRSVDVQINRLRKKLQDYPEIKIQTIRHQGYALYS